MAAVEEEHLAGEPQMGNSERRSESSEEVTEWREVREVGGRPGWGNESGGSWTPSLWSWDEDLEEWVKKENDWGRTGDSSSSARSSTAWSWWTHSAGKSWESSPSRRWSTIDEREPEDNAVGRAGRDHVPDFDGKRTMREYRRRVELFELNTRLPRRERAGKLAEKLTGEAWDPIETLDLSTLRCEEGVKILLKFLENEIGDVEVTKTGEILDEFFESFGRERGMEISAYNTQKLT
eukprot:GHVR01039678.1.p1 GENE.GHVR01039678.1~~GHVR01039678.1.p1  ORF type:complete len:236 (+),score=41.27 GHVR01039678.1:326-1033(+)